MILEYKLKYLSNNNLYETYLENILKNKDVEYTLFKEDDTIFLYLDAEESILLKVSDELSKELPSSIFLKDFALEVVSQVPKKDYIYTPVKYKLSFCKECLAMTQHKEESTNSYNPFLDCNTCGATPNVKNIQLLENNEELIYENYENLFDILASKISEGKKVKIKTTRGEFVYSKLTNLEDEDKLLCTQMESLNKIAVGSKEKSTLFLSVERPSINFNINAIYKKNHSISKEKINIVMPYDMILYFLSSKLEKYNVEFLAINDSEDFDCEFTYESDEEKQQVSKIAYNEGQVLVLESNCYKKELDDLFNTFKEKPKAQFMTVIDENKLFSKSIVNIFVSTKSEDEIILFSDEIDGMLNILNYTLPKSMNEVFEKISENETGKRLVENYKTKFPENFQNALDFDISTLKANSINSLWELVSAVLGIENILETANKALLQKGPRIDYKLKDSDKLFNREFVLTKLFQSGMSFKLAGVDDKTLALGYVESYSEFLGKIIDDVSTTFNLDGVSLCGDMIADELFYKQINKTIGKNYKIYFNKDFPIEV